MTRFLLGRTLVVSNDREFLEQGRRVLLRLGAGTVTALPDSSDLVARLRGVPPFTLVLHNPAPESQHKASLPRILRASDVIANLGRPNPEPPSLILVADQATPAELKELMALGYQEVLLKPLNDAMFETRVSDFCTRARLTPRRLMLSPETLPELPKTRLPSLQRAGGSSAEGKKAPAAPLPPTQKKAISESLPLLSESLPLASEPSPLGIGSEHAHAPPPDAPSPEARDEQSPSHNELPLAPAPSQESPQASAAGQGDVGSALDTHSADETQAAPPAGEELAPEAVAEVDPKVAEMRLRQRFILFEVDEYE